MAAFVLSILITVTLHYQELMEIQQGGFFLEKLPMILLMTFFPSIAEDILTRGYLHGHLKSLKPAQWVLLSASVDVLNHIWRLDDGLPVLAYLFFLGLSLGLSVVLKKSLWVAVGIHWGANIAIEISNAGMKTTGHDEASTLILTGVWARLFLVLLWMQNSQVKDA